MTRVFVFGLDAASLSLIERWADALPTLSRLIHEGTSGPLRSTIPPFTSPAWACMVTGKNPAKTGIFGLRQRKRNSYALKSPTSADRRAPAMWDIASGANRQVIVFNVPDTYPPTDVNGVMVSGRPAPVDAGAPITYPVQLREMLDAQTGGYLVGPTAAFDDTSRHEELPTWRDVLHRQQTALEYLLEQQQEWELCFSVSMAIDGISHHFWRFLDPEHPQYSQDEAARFGNVMRHIYQLEDRRLKRIVERLDSDDVLLIVSDHGSTPCYRHIAVNRWLIENGYLVLTDAGAGDSATQSLLRPIANKLVGLYRQNDWLRRAARPLRQTLLRDLLVEAHFAEKTGGRVPFDALDIDWEQTTAYYTGDNRLYLNVAGREPQGVIQPGEHYQRIRNELRTQLAEARDPESGKPLFAHIYTRDELYAGPYLEQAPDLVLVPGDVHWNLGGAVGDTVVDRPVTGGKHRPDGVFIAWGKDIQPGNRRDASIYDIAPTVLHVLGVPVPDDCDGTVQLDWFTAASDVRRRAIETVEVDPVEHDAYEWTAHEEEQVAARLRDLGYMD